MGTSVQVMLGCFCFFPSSQTGHQLLQLFLHPRPVQRLEARESHHKSEPFRPSLTKNPTGISELGDCAALFPKYRSDFSASAVFCFCFFFPSQQNWSGAPGAEAHTLETGVFVQIRGEHLPSRKKKKKESEDRKKERGVLMLLEGGMTKLRSESFICAARFT